MEHFHIDGVITQDQNVAFCSAQEISLTEQNDLFFIPDYIAALLKSKIVSLYDLLFVLTHLGLRA